MGKIYLMKKLFILLAVGFSLTAFSQGKSISLTKKSTEPVMLNEQMINVGDVLFFQLGANPDGSFRFVQDLNGMNEPLKPSGSRTSMMKQPIKFFKEKDGVVYAFTKYFVANLAAAVKSGEVEIIQQ